LVSESQEVAVADNSDLGKKVLIAGHGGKSTLAQAVAADLGLPYVELDALSHQPNWVETPKDEFRELVRQVLADNPEGWVIDGNYANDLQGMVAEQADTIVYVNMPYTLMMWRIFWRSVARARDKKLICGENVETWRKAFFSRDSLLWFLIKTRKNFYGRRTERLMAWAKTRETRVIELGSRAALNRFYGERGLTRD
jgi:adenylate kinase family enzyme